MEGNEEWGYGRNGCAVGTQERDGVGYLKFLVSPSSNSVCIWISVNTKSILWFSIYQRCHKYIRTICGEIKPKLYLCQTQASYWLGYCFQLISTCEMGDHSLEGHSQLLCEQLFWEKLVIISRGEIRCTLPLGGKEFDPSRHQNISGLIIINKSLSPMRAQPLTDNNSLIQPRILEISNESTISPAKLFSTFGS